MSKFSEITEHLKVIDEYYESRDDVSEATLEIAMLVAEIGIEKNVEIKNLKDKLEIAQATIGALKSEVDSCRFYKDAELELFRELWALMRNHDFVNDPKFWIVYAKIKSLEEMVDE